MKDLRSRIIRNLSVCSLSISVCLTIACQPNAEGVLKMSQHEQVKDEITTATLPNFEVAYAFQVGGATKEVEKLSEVEEKAADMLLHWLVDNSIPGSSIVRFVGSNDFGPQYKKGEKGYYFGVVLNEPIPELAKVPNYSNYFPREGNMIIEDFHGGLFASNSSSVGIKSAWMSMPEKNYLLWLEENRLVDYFGKRQCLEEYIPVVRDPDRLLELPYSKRWSAYRIYKPVENATPKEGSRSND